MKGGRPRGLGGGGGQQQRGWLRRDGVEAGAGKNAKFRDLSSGWSKARRWVIKKERGAKPNRFTGLGEGCGGEGPGMLGALRLKETKGGRR